MYDGKMGVWRVLGRGEESFQGTHQAPGFAIDLIFTCYVQRALMCRLGWKNKVQVDITMQV